MSHWCKRRWNRINNYLATWTQCYQALLETSTKWSRKTFTRCQSICSKLLFQQFYQLCKDKKQMQQLHHRCLLASVHSTGTKWICHQICSWIPNSNEHKVKKCTLLESSQYHAQELPVKFLMFDIRFFSRAKYPNQTFWVNICFQYFIYA